MHDVLSQMAALIACGVAWRVLKPQGLEADASRRVLTGLVYYLFLPALVLEVLWETPLGLDSLRIALISALGVLSAFFLTWGLLRLWGIAKPVLGAMVLAAAFPNVTYLGLPVLEKTLGTWARSVAIQYDLFACTPLLLTLGILFAKAHGHDGNRENPLLTLLKVPALWAAVAAVALNLGGVPFSPWLKQWLAMLATGVVPLMLISLGMGLRWDTWKWGSIPLLLPIIVIQLVLMPALVWQLAAALGMEGPLLIAVVLEGAMPSMVLGIVICDRYHLDTALYATAVTVTTLLSLVSVPLWYAWVGA